ncbi:heat shock 70 kDa protein-like [Cynara cardunculus var. scolymus]|uniref:heat shock 70 kDa protein-like n=1 Tax=Cynara cardunculus var. scolymus TaxID=59895 RepID=UPI000D62E5FE|nr:heat shock 70 kDa protein-like [Cynara cardunculus var. scolymus]XP_024965143.1 heat shock 70 kDa protein-like [Cynara cardunculus var. scolymus]
MNALIIEIANGSQVVVREIVRSCVLGVEGKEFREQAIKITDGGGLSKAGIAKMIKDAERYKQEEEAHIKKVMAHKALNDYVYRLRVNLNRYKIRLSLIMDMGLSVKDLEEIEYEIKETIEWLDENLMPILMS